MEAKARLVEQLGGQLGVSAWAYQVMCWLSESTKRRSLFLSIVEVRFGFGSIIFITIRLSYESLEYGSSIFGKYA